MKKLFSNAVLCLYRGLLFVSVVLLVGDMMGVATQTVNGLYYAAGQLLALGVSMVPSRRRVAVMLVAALAYIAAGVFVLGVIESPAAAVIVLLCAIAYLLTTRAGSKGDPYDPRLMVAGVVIHAAAPVVIQLSGMEIYYGAMQWLGIAFFMMCPFIMNDMSVRTGMSLRGRGGQPIKRISRVNRVMVAGLMVIVLLIANAENIRRVVERAFNFVMYWLGQLIWWLMNLMPEQNAGSGQGGGSDDMGLGALDSGEPSWFAKVLEKVAMVIVAIILLALVVFVLYKLGKLLRRVYLRIAAWAKRFAQSVKEDYLEEREQLLDWGEVRGEMIDSIKEAIKKLTTREPKWSELSARERVRYVMRQLYRKRGVAVSGIEYMSAQQALDEMSLPEDVRRDMGELYDRARYSDHDVTEAQAETMRQRTK